MEVTMKFKIYSIAAIMLALTLFAASCSHSLDNNYPKDLIDLNLTSDYPKDLNASDLNSDYPILNFHPDWPSYNTAEEIVKAATNIYSGTVIEISFSIVDMKTGSVDEDPKSTSTSRMLYTIYTVEVQESYKGDNASKIKICKTGGLNNYRVKEQYDLMNISGMLSQYSGIPVCDDECSLAVGKEYLFCTSRTAGDFDYIINPTQFAYDPNSENAKAIIKAL